MTHILSRYDFSSYHHKSFRDTIGWECIVKDDGVRSRLIKLKILSVEQTLCRPNTPCFDVSSTSSDGTMQDAVLPSQCYSDLCVLCS